MNGLFFESSIKNLVFPAIVAFLAAYFSYKGAYKLNEDRQNKDTVVKTRDLIDRIVLDLEKLVSILDILKEDAEKLRFFSLINTRIARDVINKLRGHFYSITLFESEKLRKEVIEVVDASDSLITGMDLIENIILDERRKSEQKRGELENRYADMKLSLLEQDYYIDVKDNSKPKPINNKKRNSETKSQVIESLILELVNSLKESQDRVSSLDIDYEKKRTYTVVKILDVQTKLRGLITSLEDQRKKI